MKELYIYHHLGLGDHIICNAIVRHYSKQNDKIYLFVKPHNYHTVNFMYRDLKNLLLIEGDDSYAEKYLQQNNVNFIKIGFNNCFYNGHSFDRGFFEQCNLDFFENRWDSFYVQRDLEKESKLYDLYNKPTNYIFIHDDINRGFIIDEKYKKDNYIQPKIGLTNNIFDYLTLIQMADEIHCIESSFLFMIDSMFNGIKVFIHRSERYQPPKHIPYYNNKNEYIIL